MQYQPFILGMILILVLLFMPRGIFGLSGIIRNKIKELTGKKVTPAENK
jgi:membrane-bound ClpP family serine protease